MLGLGWPEIALILVIALIFLGPKKLPEVAKGLGKALAEFRRTTQEVRDSIELEVQRSDEAARLEAARARARAKEVQKAAQPAESPPGDPAPATGPAISETDAHSDAEATEPTSSTRT